MRPLQNALVLAVALALSAAPAFAESTSTGQWSVQREASSTTRVQFELRSEDHWNNSHPVDLSALNLPAADLDSPGKHVTFTIPRAAGTFNCDGWAGKGQASGTFTFTPNAAFFASLTKRGYAIVEPSERMGIASVDLTLPYIDSIVAAGYPHLDLRELTAFRALGVTPDSIAGLHSTFGKDVSSGNVISLTALRVTPDYVTELRALGIQNITASRAIELRALGIDRSYVDAMAKAGYPHLDADQLVQLKALGVDDAYLKHLADHGIHGVSVAKLVELKAMGI